MFIKTITIEGFKSISKLMCLHAEKYNVIASDGHRPNHSDIADAIRFVLDENYHDCSKTSDNAIGSVGHVRLVVTFPEDVDGPLPGLLVDAQHREFTVTRYLDRPVPITITIDGDETVYNMSVSHFHRLLFGSGHPWNTWCHDIKNKAAGSMSLSSSLIDTECCVFNPLNVSDTSNDDPLETRDEYQRRINALRNCRDLMQRFSGQLVAAEELALERRTLRYLRNAGNVPEWQRRLQQCQQELDDRSEQDVADERRQAEHTEAVLQCQRNLHIKWGTHKMAGLLAHVDAVRKCLQVLQHDKSISVRAAPNDAKLEALQEGRLDLIGELEVLDREQTAVRSKLVGFDLELFANSFAGQPNVDSLQALVDRYDAVQQRMLSEIARMSSARLRFDAGIAAANRKVVMVRETVHTRQKERDALRAAVSEATNNCIQRIENIHRQHLEWLQYYTTNLYHPTMRAVFHMDQLIAVDSINAALDAVPELARDFVGFVIDFVVFKPEHIHLAAKVLFPLKDLLLNIVFTTERQMIQCTKFAMLGNLQMWAIDSYRPNPITIGMPPTPHIQPLSTFLQPLPEHPTIVDLLDDFVVMDTTDVDELSEVARLFKRHVICARTGRWTKYGSPYDFRTMVCDDDAQAASDNAATVFDVWRRNPKRADHYKDLLRQSDQRNELRVEEAVHDLISAQLVLDKARTEERSTLFRLNVLQENAFRLDRTAQQARSILHNMQTELHAYAQLLSDCPAAQRSGAEIRRICIEKQRTELAAMQSSAKITGLCDRIRSHFRCVTSTIVDGRSVDVDIVWLDDAMRAVGQCREAIEGDWQRLAETIFCGRPVEERLAEVRVEWTALKRCDVLFGLQKAFTKQLQQIARDERLLDDRSLLEHFDGWTPRELSQRRHQLQRTVDSDAALGKTRRRYERFSAQMDADLAVAKQVLRAHQALYERMFAQRRHQIGRVIDVMRTLLPLVCRTVRGDMPQLMLVTTVAEVGQQRSLELVLKNVVDGDGRLMHVGRHEKRWLSLMVYLAGCVVRKERAVLVLDDLLQNFSDAEMVQIVGILDRTEMLSGLQCFHVADSETMRRYMTPGV